MKNYSLENIGSIAELTAKHFSKETLGLTAMEVSVNHLKPQEGVPFVHTHKNNEELYIVIKGNGIFYVDKEEFDVKEGSLIRVATGASRAIQAKDDGLDFICIQAKENSLEGYTMTDGSLVKDEKASWM